MSSTDRLCDFCSKSKALLYCRADSAKLCFGCDREVHSTNQLFTKHTRWLLCDSCDSSPASIFCHTHGSVFCQNCDWEAHSQGPGPHDRRPVEGFSGCPSVSELLGLLGLDDLGKKAVSVEDDQKHEKHEVGVPNDDKNVDMDFGLVDLLGWDGPTVVSIDELIGSGGDDSAPAHNFQALGVGPLPKNRNAVCGQYKDEILHQLREISKSEPDCEGCVDSLINVQCRPEKICQLEDQDAGFDCNREPTFIQPHETNTFEWGANGNKLTDEALIGSYTDTNYLVPEKESEFGDSSTHLDDGGHDGSFHLIKTENLHVVPKVSPRELNSQERDSAISRYKEKKKNRRYDKHIRYESRKVRAESRKRINGRFARKDHPAADT